MKIGNKELFSTKNVTGDVDKFIQKIEESENKILQLEKQLIEVEEQVNYAITQDILSDNGNKTQVANMMARKDNIQSQLEVERLTLKTIKDLNEKQLRSAIPELYKQFKEDSEYFRSTVEDEIFRRLFQIRQEQEILFLLLDEARGRAGIEANRYKTLKNSAGYSEYEYDLGGISSGHNNTEMAYSRHPEYGTPVIKWLTNVKGIKTRISQNYAETNFYVKDQNKKAIPPTITKEDLQKFLDSLAE